MTPRTDLVIIPHDSTFDQVLSVVTKSGFSRFPVIGDGGVDDILGIVLARDLLAFTPEYLASGGRHFDLRRLLRECYFIPGTKPIDDLLNELKRRKIHMAIVLDEHGGVDGAVTLEDLIEEIVGDIYDESDIADKEVVFEEGGDALIDGGLLVADVNERFSLTIPEGDYDTIAGFIFSTLGRMSVTGDKIVLVKQGVVSINDVPIDGVTKDDTPEQPEEPRNGVAEDSPTVTELTVERVSGNRIETVRIHRISPIEPEVPADPIDDEQRLLDQPDSQLAREA
jgi:CBS domain containing-hemolysin-like protein